MLSSLKVRPHASPQMLPALLPLCPPRMLLIGTPLNAHTALGLVLHM